MLNTFEFYQKVFLGKGFYRLHKLHKMIKSPTRKRFKIKTKKLKQVSFRGWVSGFLKGFACFCVSAPDSVFVTKGKF